MRKKTTGLFVLLIFLSAVVVFASGSTEGSGSETVKITMQIAEGMDRYKGLAERFEQENPGVEVQVDFMTITEWNGLARTKLENNDAPDVFIVGLPSDVDLFRQKGYVADLGDLSAVPRYKDGALTDSTFDGKIYSLPSAFTVVQVFYNKRIFDDLGLEVPTTWGEFTDACEAIKNSGTAPILYGIKDLWPPAHWISAVAPELVMSKAPSWADMKRDGKVSFATSDEWGGVFGKLQELIDKEYFNKGTASTSHDESVQMFVRGEGGMMINGTWILPGILESMPEDFELGSFPMPANDSGSLTSYLGSANYQFCVWSGSPHIDVARKWLDFTLSPESNAFFNQGAALSPLKDVTVELHPCITEFSELTQGLSAYTFPWVAWPRGVIDETFKLLQEMFIAVKRTDDVLQSLDTIWSAKSTEN